MKKYFVALGSILVAMLFISESPSEVSGRVLVKSRMYIQPDGINSLYNDDDIQNRIDSIYCNNIKIIQNRESILKIRK